MGHKRIRPPCSSGPHGGGSGCCFPLLLLDRELQGAATAAGHQQQQQHHPVAGRRVHRHTASPLVLAVLRSLRLQWGADGHDEAALLARLDVPGFMRQRAAVLEMLAVPRAGLLVVLLHSGLCPVFDVSAGASTQPARLGYLNSGPQDIIRSLLLNEGDAGGASIVAVSCWANDAPVRLRCTATPACASSFAPSAGFCFVGVPVLELVGGKGFVEFDDASQRALLLNADTKQYKVYSLSDYSLLYCLPAGGVVDVKLDSLHLLLVRTPVRRHAQHSDAQAPPYSCTLDVLSTVNGQVLASHDLQLGPQSPRLPAPFDVLELFGRHLLLKQPLQPLEIRDVLTWRLCGASDDERLASVASFLHLEQQAAFMTVCGHSLAVWSFSGALLTQFDDHETLFPLAGGHQSLLHVTGDMVVSYCKPKAWRTMLPAVGEPAGAIHISSLACGSLLAAVGPEQARQHAAAAAARRDSSCHTTTPGWMHDDSHCPELTDLSALTYDEAGCCVFTGTNEGHIHLWAAGG